MPVAPIEQPTLPFLHGQEKAGEEKGYILKAPVVLARCGDELADYMVKEVGSGEAFARQV